MESEPTASLTSPRPSASAESLSSRPGDRQPPPAADTRPAEARRPADMEPRSGGVQAAPPTPRVLVFSCESRKLSTLTPFQRREGCDRFGKAIRCDKLKDGSIEVEYSEERDAKRALAATEFVFTARDEKGRCLTKLPMTVTAHRTKNSCKGVIFCFDLEGVSDSDIAEGLSGVGVTSARRIRSKRAGVLTPTHNIILTFNSVDLPQEVLVGYIRVKVRPYIPGPMRCFRCLRFGHTRDYCKNRPTCGNCAASDHTGEECTVEERKCVNCDDSQTPHSAFDPSCPALQREKDIVSIKFNERVSFREARELYKSRNPGRSYASVAKGTGAPQPAESAREQHGNISQLVSLLRSFGLSLSGPGIPPGPVTPRVSIASAATCTAASTQTSPVRAGEAGESDPGGGWTVVRGRRGSGHTSTAGGEASPPPRPPRRSGPSPTAVTEALRRRQEEQRAFEERRAGRIQKALEARSSARGEAASAASSAACSPQLPGTTALVEKAMGPPPPPPPPRTPRPTPPPPPPPDGGQAGPPAEERPAKRSLPWESSPPEGSTPRTRQRFQPGSTGGRSSSADGRLRQGHARIRFGDDTRSGADEFF